MYELGKKDEVFGTNADLTPITSVYERPSSMPYVPEGELVICGYDQGLGERMIVCESLEDMQELYDNYAVGHALRIYWYRGRIGKVETITLGPEFGIVGSVINEFAPDVPKDVKKAIALYAKGNPGCAKLLAQHSIAFKTEKEVEELVGWPLSEHTLERTAEIFDRLRSE